MHIRQSSARFIHVQSAGIEQRSGRLSETDFRASAQADETTTFWKKNIGGTMKARILIIAAAAVCLGGSIAVAQQSGVAPGKITANIDAQQVSAPISKYLYGGFIEHGGMLMYRSLWAEIVDDRKFYFPITSVEPPAPARRQAGGPFRGMALRRWKPIGPDEVVTMDKDQPFVGDQGPRITLDASTPHGIKQSRIPLVNGKQYNGRIWLRGTPGAKVNVTLSWGSWCKRQADRHHCAPHRTVQKVRARLHF